MSSRQVTGSLPWAGRVRHLVTAPLDPMRTILGPIYLVCGLQPARYLGYLAPAELLVNLTGHNTLNGCEYCRAIRWVKINRVYELPGPNGLRGRNSYNNVGVDARLNRGEQTRGWIYDRMTAGLRRA